MKYMKKVNSGPTSQEEDHNFPQTFPPGWREFYFQNLGRTYRRMIAGWGRQRKLSREKKYVRQTIL